jgi:hypothetical protein
VDLITEAPVIPRPRVPIEAQPVYSAALPRELVDFWPERTDCCEGCLHPAGHRPIAEERRGLKTISQYRCRLCGHSWTATWRGEE